MPLIYAIGLLFLVLKLMEITVVATWSWWLVLLPLYAPAAFGLAIMLFCLAMAGITALVKK